MLAMLSATFCFGRPEIKASVELVRARVLLAVGFFIFMYGGARMADLAIGVGRRWLIAKPH